MKQLTLTFPRRIGLWNFLTVYSSPVLGKTKSMGRIYDAVRFSDQDLGQIKLTNVGNGMTSFEPPTLDFGHIETNIEDADAAMLLQEINSPQSNFMFRVTDRQWVDHVEAELSAPSKKGS